jgi:DNA repair protein RecO (recombination protein O)
MVASDRIRKVEAIVISHTDYGETDRILSLFTRELGKIRAIAKGIRKEHSRKAGHLEPFTCSILMLARGTSFWIISQADTVNAFDAIRQDLTKTALAAYCLELVERFTTENEVHLALYRLLKDTLARLTRQEPSFNAIRFFELRFLELVGFRPEFFYCVQCGVEIKPEDQFLSLLQGGVLCPRCGNKVDSSQPIATTTLKYFRHFQRSEYDEIRQIEISTDTQQKMENLMQRYIAFLAERKLNTPAFYREIHPAFNTQKNDNVAGDRINQVDE